MNETWEKTLYNNHEKRGICFIHIRAMDEYGIGAMAGRVDYSDSGIGKWLYSFRILIISIKFEVCLIL